MVTELAAEANYTRPRGYHQHISSATQARATAPIVCTQVRGSRPASGPFASWSLRWQGLRHRYAEGASLSYADLDLPAAGILLITGASGSGKSTLLALLTGLRACARARASVMGRDLATVPTGA